MTPIVDDGFRDAAGKFREICRQMRPQIDDAGLRPDLERAEVMYRMATEVNENFVGGNSGVVGCED